MLYKFKSHAVADLIMLPAHGTRVLEIIGKTPGATGIVTAAQIPAAMAALEAAVAADEARRAEQAAAPASSGVDEAQEVDADAFAEQGPVHLRQRVAPFLDMLRRSAAEGADVVWGV